MSSKLTPISEVEKALLATVKPVEETEYLPLTHALHRVLAMEQQSSIDVPSFDNSAMDGYALRVSDWAKQQKKATEGFPIQVRVAAGDTLARELGPNACARIMTGARVPQGADAVVMQEQCRLTDDNRVIFPEVIFEGDNIRLAGQDIRKGEKLLAKGSFLGPQELGLLASVGLAEVSVKRRLRVAIFSTGDEVIEPGQGLKPGQIYNSNRYTLIGVLQGWGMEVVDLGVVSDSKQATSDALLAGAEQADCVITTGGVSVGEADYVKEAVSALGTLDLWRVAIKPGKPFAFGRVGATPFIGLPGNPAAVLVTLLILVKPFLRALLGLDYRIADAQSLPVTFSCSKPLIREQFLFVKKVNQGGGACLQSHPNQSSGILSASCWASGLARVPIDTLVHAGDTVHYYDYRELFQF